MWAYFIQQNISIPPKLTLLMVKSIFKILKFRKEESFSTERNTKEKLHLQISKQDIIFGWWTVIRHGILKNIS